MKNALLRIIFSRLAVTLPIEQLIKSLDLYFFVAGPPLLETLIGLYIVYVANTFCGYAICAAGERDQY